MSLTTTDTRLQKQAEFLQRARGDLAWYASTYLKIKTKRGELVPFKLNPSQALVHKRLEEQKRKIGKVRAIVLKARQQGISTYTAARFYHGSTLWKYQNGLIIADEKKRSQMLFNIYDTFDRNLPQELRPTQRYVSKQQQMWWDNDEGTGLDSKIDVNTANDTEAGRAGTLQRVHASELAFWFAAEETFGSLAEAVPGDSGEIVIESTANGVGNFFHNTWELAEEGTSDYIAIFLPWWIHPEYQKKLSKEDKLEIRKTEDPYERKCLDEGFMWEGKIHKLLPEQLAWRRMKLSEPQYRNHPRKFQQEYPAEPHEAFIASGNGFFDIDALDVLDRECIPPKFRGNVIEKDGGVDIQGHPNGFLRIWEPPKPGGVYVIGADTAGGRSLSGEMVVDDGNERGGSDFSCADVYEATTRTYVAQLHGRMAPEEFARQLFLLGYLYVSETRDGNASPALLGVEKNYSSGETVLKKLDQGGAKHDRYPNLFYARQWNRRHKKVTPVLGWLTTTETRQPMLDELAEGIRQVMDEESSGLTILNKDFIKEARTFVVTTNGKPVAQEGAHDDRVMAAAITLQIARFVSTAPKGRMPEVEVNDSPTGW